MSQSHSYPAQQFLSFLTKTQRALLWKVIFISWLIAFLEYCFQVPANRIGHNQFSAAQLKTIQEVIPLIVFSVFSILYLKEEFRWNYAVGVLLMTGLTFRVHTANKFLNGLIKVICCGNDGGGNLVGIESSSLFNLIL